MSTFTPPTIDDIPQYPADASDDDKRFWGHFRRHTRGVNVYKLSDGTYVQDTPTPDHPEAGMVPPQPLMPDQGPNEPNLLSVNYDIYGNRTTVPQDPYIVHTYFGGHTEEVDDVEAAALITAGYGDFLT